MGPPVARRRTNGQAPASRRRRGEPAAPGASQAAESSPSPSPAQDFQTSVDAAVLARANPVPWHHVGRLQLAQLLGVHPDSVTDFTRQGMPVITRGGHGKESLYDAIECLAWWRKRQGKDALETAKTRAANANAQMNELKIQQTRGELLPREQVILAGQAMVKQVATTIRALPRRMTQAGLIQRADEPTVAAFCADVTKEIAEWRPTPGGR